MAMLDEVGAYLASQGHGTLASTIFLSLAPDTPDSIVTLYEIGGMTPGFTMAALPAVDQPRLQVIVRDPDYQQARIKAGNIWRTLAAVLNTTLSGTMYLAIQPMDSPAPNGRDSKQRDLIGSMYQVSRIPPATES